MRLVEGQERAWMEEAACSVSNRVALKTPLWLNITQKTNHKQGLTVSFRDTKKLRTLAP
jgi:hypothetical protein